MPVVYKLPSSVAPLHPLPADMSIKILLSGAKQIVSHKLGEVVLRSMAGIWYLVIVSFILTYLSGTLI